MTNESLEDFVNRREQMNKIIIDHLRDANDTLNGENRMLMEYIEKNGIEIPEDDLICFTLRRQYRIEKEFIRTGLIAYNQIAGSLIGGLTEFLANAYELVCFQKEMAKYERARKPKQVWDKKSCQYNGCDNLGDYMTSIGEERKFVCKGHTRLSKEGLSEDVWKTEPPSGD